MIHTWEKTNTALNLIADSIRDKAQGKPIRETIAEAKEILAKVNLELSQFLTELEPK